MSKKVVQIKYSEVCKESFPCKHNGCTLVYEDGTTKPANANNGVDIMKLFKKHGLEIPPHFAEYNREDVKERLRQMGWNMDD